MDFWKPVLVASSLVCLASSVRFLFRFKSKTWNDIININNFFISSCFYDDNAKFECFLFRARGVEKPACAVNLFIIQQLAMCAVHRRFYNCQFLIDTRFFFARLFYTICICQIMWSLVMTFFFLFSLHMTICFVASLSFAKVYGIW